jgi:hypothetical protein
VRQAVGEYAPRMSIEETFRDWHNGWGVRAAVSGLPTEARVERLMGVICLAYSLQLHLGQRLSRDPTGQQRRAQWPLTDRISWFWCGQRLFSDPGYEWRKWWAAQWAALTTPRTPALPEPVPTLMLAEAA